MVGERERVREGGEKGHVPQSAILQQVNKNNPMREKNAKYQMSLWGGAVGEVIAVVTEGDWGSKQIATYIYIGCWVIDLVL